MSLILSGDLSLNSSGLVVMDLDRGSPIHYEAVTSDLDNIERLNYNYHRYFNLLMNYRDIEYIAFEAQTQQMRFSYNAGSILTIAENVGIWKKAIYDSIPYLSSPPVIFTVPAQDIKAFATGNYKAEKDDMINAVNGNHIKSIRRDIPEHSVNDIADAYHLAKLIRDILKNNKEDEYRKYLVKDYRKEGIQTL